MEALSLKCVSSPILPIDPTTLPSLDHGSSRNSNQYGSSNKDGGGVIELTGSHDYLDLIACLTLGIREARQALISHRGLYQVMEQVGGHIT